MQGFIKIFIDDSINTLITRSFGISNIKINFESGQQKPMDQKEQLKEMANKTKVFASQLRGMPDFIAVFKLLTNLRLLMCMVTALVMGAGIGIISTFLFWHLQVMLIPLFNMPRLYYIIHHCICTKILVKSSSKIYRFAGLWRYSNLVWNRFRYQSSI